MRALIDEDLVHIAHDLSDGGLAVALAEMVLEGGIGATISRLPEGPSFSVLFGEDQGRYLLSVAQKDVQTIIARAQAKKVPILEIGKTGGDALQWPGNAPILLKELEFAFEAPLPAYMSGDDQAFTTKI